MLDQQITEVDSHKHLGEYFSNDCSWHRHINYIKDKAWSRINIMRKLKFKLDRKSLETIYLTFIRPILEYGDVVWPVGAASRYNLRNANNLQTITTRTNLYYQSFLPTTIRSWKNLPIEIKQADTVNSFKNYLIKKQPVPKYYYVGNRWAQILHTRLRTNCSSLNIDLFNKNISDSPLCSCGSIEDAQHFFFHCRHYTVQRNALLNAVSTYIVPSLKCILYGDPSLSLELNSNIFQHVQKFIIDTKRF